MNKERLIIVICLIAVVATSGVIAYQALIVNTGPKIDPDDPFNIVFRYGVWAKNELNTFNGTFTKDLIINGTVTTALVLSEEELDGLQQKIVDMGLFAYPDSFPLHPTRRVDPQADCYIMVQSGSTVKEVGWNSNSFIESNMQDNLDGFEAYVVALIEQRQEYQALPTPTGGYC